MKKITRRLPQSPLEINTALATAKATKDSNLPGRQALKTDTAAELNVWVEKFTLQYNVVSVAQAAVNKYTPIKVKARNKVRLFCSQFMHAVNFEIAQGILMPGDRAYYGMDISTGNFLPLNSEAKIKESASLLIDGENSRIAAGGTPIVYPAVAALAAANSDLMSKWATYSNLVAKHFIEKQKLSRMARDAGNFIRIMWSEIESTFAAMPIESRRANSRAWGVVYTNMTVNIPVKLEVIDAATGEPIAGANATLENARLMVVLNNSGNGALFTPDEGPDVLKIVATGYNPVVKNIYTTDGKTLILNIEMQKAA
ncbi:MAG: hypothetical protein ABI723_06255 [Bacteroidia bacterium]